MGWLFHNDMLRSQTPAEYITQHFSCETDTHKAIVLATATVKGTIFAAIRNEIKSSGIVYIFCGVFLFKNNKRDGFGYKDMDEFHGPLRSRLPGPHHAPAVACRRYAKPRLRRAMARRSRRRETTSRHGS